MQNEEISHNADMRYGIDSDGVTVWVNGSAGECIGRFGRNGIDIHTTIEAQTSGKPQCLHCTHEPTTINDWWVFLKKMHELYHIDPDILGEHIPNRFIG